MTILPLPDHRRRKIVVGTTVRKPLPILEAYLQSLDWQQLPKQTDFEFVFVSDFAPDQGDASQLLLKWVNERGGKLIAGHPAASQDFSDAPGSNTHHWQLSSMARVGANKNLIIQYALDSKADAVWFVDADLIMERTTFLSLDSCQVPIVTANYWTRWNRQSTETGRISAGPQTWLTHPYGLSGRGMDEAEFRGKLLDRGVHQVWGYGACTLIQRKVLEAGVNYDYLPDVPKEGMMGGEDRHFCIKAERMHIPAYADCWPDIFHIYHAPDDVARIPQMVERLGAIRRDRAALGDLVSVRLRPLEPIPIGPGRFQQPIVQFVRGRLGTLALLPEIEETIYTLKRGQQTIIRAHFPLHHPLPFLRGRTRLIEVQLVDVKPICLPPVVEDELYVGPNSGTWQDSATTTEEQQEMIRG